MTTDQKILRIVPGDQLFAPSHLPPVGSRIYFMAEDVQLCTRVRHHQQKIVLFLAGMRHYRDHLQERGDAVQYRQLEDAPEQSYEQVLVDVLQEEGITAIELFRPADPFFATRIEQVAETVGLPCTFLPNPGFCTPEDELTAYLSGRKQLKMHDFYLWQRQHGRPVGG